MNPFSWNFVHKETDRQTHTHTHQTHTYTPTHTQTHTHTHTHTHTLSLSLSIMRESQTDRLTKGKREIERDREGGGE